jgi:cell division protein FtsI/penicillin-binding protein 2
MGIRSFDLLGAKRGVIVIEGSRARLTVIGVIVMFLFSALFARLWFLQVASDSNYAAAATSNRSRVVYEPALRGRILDRNGKPIVDNEPVDVVTFDRHKEMTSAERKLVVARVAQQLGVTADEIEKRIDDPRASPVAPVSIATGIPPEVRTYIEEHETYFPGVKVVRTAVRAYPSGPVAANLIGYVSEINADELKAHEKEGYREGDPIGKDGVEQTFEDVLRGRPRKLEVQVDSRGRVVRTIEDQKAVAGKDVKLTLDVDVQRLAEQSLAEGDPRPEREAAPGELPGRRRSRGRARSERRIGRRNGVEPHVRPPPVRRRHHARGVPAAQPAGEQLPAREPGRAGSVRAGVDVQALHGARGSPDRAARPERRLLRPGVPHHRRRGAM